MDRSSSSTVRLATRFSEAISLDWSGYKSHQEAVSPSLVTTKRHGQVNVLDLDMRLQRKMSRTGATFRVQPYCKPGNWQCLRLHTLHLLPWTPYLPRMGAGGASQASDSQ